MPSFMEVTKSIFEPIKAKKPEPPKTALAIAQSLIATPKPPNQSKCGKCLNSGFWLPIGSTEPICIQCQPPSAPTLVAKQFFFDDWGNVWRAEVNADGLLSCIRETFEKGSPDVQ